MIIFVYGTLLSGLPLSHVLYDSGFVGDAVAGGVQLYDLGSYPAIKHGKGKVFGELYNVDVEILQLIDMVEGYCPSNLYDSLYIRSEIQIILPAISSIVFAYYYNHQINDATRIIKGDYRQYLQSLGDETPSLSSASQYIFMSENG